MISALKIKNFRSIREADMPLGRVTILNGANNSGKSSVLYALQFVRNIVSNPNQSLAELLNLRFLNLGNFEDVAFCRDNRLEMEIGISANENAPSFIGQRAELTFGFTSGWSSIRFECGKPGKAFGEIHISYPYPLNQEKIIATDNGQTVNWNGFDAKPKPPTSRNFARRVNMPVRAISQVDIVPDQRGFKKPIYNLIPLQSAIYTEDEVATLLATDKNLQSKVSFYFEKITGKRLTVSLAEGAGFFFLQVREGDSQFSTELVNQGMGLNQIAYILIKALYSKTQFLCIDEPEIHLHPELIERFVKTLVEIAKNEGKQFLFSTHSEHFISCFLAEVHDKNLPDEDLKVYFLKKNGMETVVEAQKVHANGQLEGGLKNFLEAQTRLTNRFFPA